MKSKKIICFIVSIVMLLALVPNFCYGQENASVVLNGKKLEFDVPPQIINGRTLVPFRTIFETLGYIVVWDEEEQIATGVNVDKDLIIAFKIGYPAIFSAKYSDSDNVKETPIDVPAQVVDERTLIPLRALSDSIGAEVQWDDNTSTVYITNNVSQYTEKKSYSNFDKVASFIKKNGDYEDGEYSLEWQNVILSYKEADENINLFQFEEDQYSILMVIYKNGKVGYLYDNIDINTSMQGEFYADELSNNKEQAVPYYSYKGLSQIESTINKQATFALKIAVSAADIILILNNSNCSMADLGFTYLLEDK